MKRLEFIHTTLMLMGLSRVKYQNSFGMDPYLLIGKGSPELVGKNYALLPEASEAFEAMASEAKKEGILVKIVSSYRSFERQKSIWNSKFSNFKAQGMSDSKAIEKIIEYSTLPGTSRHHWGTDIDLIDTSQPAEGDVLVPQKFHQDGPYVQLRKWMDKHAESFGFYLPYTDDSSRTGFEYEPWHYSFAPLSKPMLKDYLELNHAQWILSEDLEGGEVVGKEFLESYLETHVKGINPTLL